MKAVEQCRNQPGKDRLQAVRKYNLCITARLTTAHRAVARVYAKTTSLSLSQDYNANMTGSAVIPWVESTGFAQLYIRFYRTNDNQSNSAQVTQVDRCHITFAYGGAGSLCLTWADNFST